VRLRRQSGSAGRPLNFTVRSRMLIRAIAAFVALPGIVAFALPIAIGTSAGRPVQHVAIAGRSSGLRHTATVVVRARIPRLEGISAKEILKELKRDR